MDFGAKPCVMPSFLPALPGAAQLPHVGLAPEKVSGPFAASPVELAAWANLCRVILNLHETITRF